MNWFRLIVLLLPLVLTACGLSPQQKADYASVQTSGVNSAVYDKMMHGDALSVSDIESLAHARVSDAVILRYIRENETIYYLNSADVEGLRKAGVSQSVIDYMLSTPRYAVPPYYPAIDFGYDPFWYGGYGGYGHHDHHHWR